MRQRTPLRAIMETAFVVLIGPWLVALIGLIFLAMTRADEEVLGAALLVWFVSCMVYNGWFARRARRTLERDFRMLATR